MRLHERRPRPLRGVLRPFPGSLRLGRRVCVFMSGDRVLFGEFCVLFPAHCVLGGGSASSRAATASSSGRSASFSRLIASWKAGLCLQERQPRPLRGVLRPFPGSLRLGRRVCVFRSGNRVLFSDFCVLFPAHCVLGGGSASLRGNRTPLIVDYARNPPSFSISKFSLTITFPSPA
ncbi:hypothetical protein EV207_12246 [Scopulibacillus darangshiensis]|uniref:Uncharacterized protein n=1 Tax=Scopulibacillus darangshiensis TaxID=442528 RepID=A0A4R2NSM2_9BACL|nr:hypothetical protein EV207_12246 [Scopulibacillus darangshiensis]